MSVIEPSIGFVIDFYDKNGKEVSSRYLTSFTHKELVEKENQCKQDSCGSFSRLQNDEFFDNIKMVPGLLYDPAPEKWSLGLSSDLKTYNPLASKSHAEGENSMTLYDYDITKFVRGLLNKEYNAASKKQCYLTTANGIVIVITAISGISQDGKLQDLDKYHAEQNKFLDKVLNEIKVASLINERQ